MDEDVFEALLLWPVRLLLPGCEGLTLWGSGGDPEGTDRLLVVDGQLVVCASEDSLRTFVDQDERSLLVHLPGYAAVRQALRDPLTPIEPHVVDYPSALALLAEPAECWSLAGCGDLVDAFNLLRDIADTLGDVALRRSFRGDGYQALVDEFTFITAEEVEATVRRLDTPALGERLRADLERVTASASQESERPQA